MQNQIAFVTPTNLIAILRMAESLWKLDAQNENASNIAKRAGHLIDKFSGLNDDLVNIGKYLNLAGKAFDAADNKLSSGKGTSSIRLKNLKLLEQNQRNLFQRNKDGAFKTMVSDRITSSYSINIFFLSFIALIAFAESSLTLEHQRIISVSINTITLGLYFILINFIWYFFCSANNIL